MRQAGDDSYGRLVRRQQVQRVARELPVNMLAVPVIVGVCVAVFWSRIPHNVLFAWAAYAVLVTLAGAALAFAYRRAPDKFRTRVWIRLFVVFALFDATNWALVPWLFYLPDEPLYHFFVGALVLGIAAGGQVAYVSVLPAAAVLVIGVLLPTAVRLATMEETIHQALAALTVVFMAVVLSISGRMSASLIEAWRLRHRIEERTRALTEEVAERRKAEEQLIIFRRFADHSAQSMGIADLEGNVINGNPFICQFFGFGALEDLTGHPLRELHDAHFAELFSSEILPTLAASGRWSGEVVSRKSNGELFPSIDTYFIIRDDDGEPFCMGFTVADLTAQKASEERLHAAIDEADRANQAKTEFLSSMSHELRTPMNAILGFAQLLDLDRDTKLDADQRNYLRQILGGGQHLLTLINDILDLAKIEAGAIALDRAPVAVRRLIDDSLDLLMPLATKNGLTVTDETRQSDLPPMLGDAMRLKQVVINLLSNAIKFTPSGGSVTLSATTTADGKIRLSVADTGPGLDEAQQALLFRSFTRIGAHSEQAEGTGIGLAICRQLVEHMAGRIGVDSVPGKGSTFWIEIPLAAADVEAVDATPPLVGEDARNLLYVDSNASNLSLIEEVLARTPQVFMSWADSLDLALELIKLRRPDAILIDIGSNGSHALNRLLDDPGAAKIPIIALANEVGTSQMASLQMAGVRAFIAKPITVPVLIEALTSALDEGARNQPRA